MAITYDTTSTAINATDPTSLTWSHTTTTASNRILIVGTSTESDTGGHTAQTVSGITYNGVALTKVRSDYITDNGTELWYLVAPATGANNIVVTMTAVVDGLFGAGFTFSGVDQANPIDANAGTTTTGTSISQALTTVATDAMIVNIVHHYNSAVVLTADANQTERFNTPTTGDNDQAGGTRLVTTPTSYTTSWTADISDGMTLSVLSLKPFPTAVLTGTITSSVNESDIVTGGKTLIITLTNDTWIAAGAGSFDLQRDEIIAGVTSAQSEATGWNLVPKLSQSLGGVVRTSDTVVTITWDAFATYNITATETITVTVPSTAVTGAGAIVATPTFTITAVGGSTVKTLAALGVG